MNSDGYRSTTSSSSLIKPLHAEQHYSPPLSPTRTAETDMGTFWCPRCAMRAHAPSITAATASPEGASINGHRAAPRDDDRSATSKQHTNRHVTFEVTGSHPSARAMYT